MTQPLQRVDLDALARALSTLYANAEAELIGQLGRIARGEIVDGDQAAKLAAIRSMNLAAQRTVATLTTRMPGLVRSTLATARRDGAAAALSQLRAIQAAMSGRRLSGRLSAGLLSGPIARAIPNTAALDQLAADLTGRLAATHPRILRYASDAYRTAIAASQPLQLTGATTGRIAERAAWRQLMSQGITGFTDRAGRNWSLSTYTEMSTRTAAQRSFNAAHKDQMNDVGITLYVVSQDGGPCTLCAPWEGQILSDDSSGPLTVGNALTGAAMSVNVAGTVAEAQAAGLQHPNCRHQLLAYVPGASEQSNVALPPPSDELLEQQAQRAKDEQRLRLLERNVRAAKLAKVSALDDVTRQTAQRQITQGQAAIREHTSRTGLTRRNYREQPNLGHR